jgi:hypothetical protein
VILFQFAEGFDGEGQRFNHGVAMGGLFPVTHKFVAEALHMNPGEGD